MVIQKMEYINAEKFINQIPLIKKIIQASSGEKESVK